MCHAAGQTRSTPILLKYGKGDWNALHRDLYGELVFPLQVVINLSNPGVDHTGGEFLLYEQRRRAQSRATATLIPHGHGLVFTTRDRPVQSARGWSAAPVRHGVSVIRSGQAVAHPSGSSSTTPPDAVHAARRRPAPLPERDARAVRRAPQDEDLRAAGLPERATRDRRRRLCGQPRVFFADEPAAAAAGYRPCAICMPTAHKSWKAR